MKETDLSQDLSARLKPLLAVALLLALGLAALALWGPRREAVLPMLGQVPHFELVGTDRRPFNSAVLDGKVWVASFVFTTCKNSCPMLTLQMSRLSKLLPAGDGVALLSITVDPDKDSPELLRSYAAKTGAEDPRWHFLTGKKSAIKTLVEKGFKLTADPGVEILDERGEPDILHSSKLVLVDGQGRIRGYYDGLLGASVPAMQGHLQRLLKE